MEQLITDALVTMDPDDARERLRDYRRSLHRRADAEYEAIATGLEEIAEGRRLIDARAAIVAGGWHEDGRPRLAIARADRRQVRCDWMGANALRFDSGRRSGYWSETLTLQYALNEGERPEWKEWRDDRGWWRNNRPRIGHALVPLIPPAARRESDVARSRDREHFILFEVEQWSDTPLRAEPDRDPFLLRRLGGDLFVILAAWDLTDLERAIMAGRRDA